MLRVLTRRMASSRKQQAKPNNPARQRDAANARGRLAQKPEAEDDQRLCGGGVVQKSGGAVA